MNQSVEKFKTRDAKIRVAGIVLATVGAGLEIAPLSGIFQVIGVPLIVGGLILATMGKRIHFSPFQDIDTRRE